MHCTSRSIFAIICIRLLHQYGFPCTKCTTSIPIWCVYVRVFLSMCWRCPETRISSELYVLQHFVLLSFININIASCIHHYSLILYQLHVCSLYSWNTCLHKRSITTISSPSNPCHCLSICFGSVCVYPSNECYRSVWKLFYSSLEYRIYFRSHKRHINSPY